MAVVHFPCPSRLLCCYAAIGRASTNSNVEHTQRLLTKSPEVTTNTIQHYKMLLRVIFDNEPLIPQTSQTIMTGRTVTTLTPNFLCLQCPTTVTIKERELHGQMKAHMFCRVDLNGRHSIG